MKTDIDQLLDRHQKRLTEDPGYQVIWHNVMEEAPAYRLLVAMDLWAQQSDGLRHLICASALGMGDAK